MDNKYIISGEGAVEDYRPNGKVQDQIKESWEEEFDRKWKRIEKTMTGHISGRKIWDVDSNNNDDESNYLYVDETIKHFIHTLLKRQKEEIVKTLEEAEVECSGSCGAGCEIAIRNLIDKLKENHDTK